MSKTTIVNAATELHTNLGTQRALMKSLRGICAGSTLTLESKKEIIHELSVEAFLNYPLKAWESKRFCLTAYNQYSIAQGNFAYPSYQLLTQKNIQECTDVGDLQELLDFYLAHLNYIHDNYDLLALRDYIK